TLEGCDLPDNRNADYRPAAARKQFFRRHRAVADALVAGVAAERRRASLLRTPRRALPSLRSRRQRTTDLGRSDAMKPARLGLLPSICAALILPLAGAQAQTLKKLSDGQVSKTAPNWPNFIASDKGFFRRAGVEPEPIYVGNVANTVQQLVAGSF